MKSLKDYLVTGAVLLSLAGCSDRKDAPELNLDVPDPNNYKVQVENSPYGPMVYIGRNSEGHFEAPYVVSYFDKEGKFLGDYRFGDLPKALEELANEGESLRRFLD